MGSVCRLWIKRHSRTDSWLMSPGFQRSRTISRLSPTSYCGGRELAYQSSREGLRLARRSPEPPTPSSFKSKDRWSVQAGRWTRRPCFFLRRVCVSGHPSGPYERSGNRSLAAASRGVQGHDQGGLLRECRRSQNPAGRGDPVGVASHPAAIARRCRRAAEALVVDEPTYS